MPSFDLTRIPSTDPIRLYRYRDGLYAADLMIAAVAHLDVFSWLGAHPSDLPGICRHFGIHPRPTDVLLTLLSANGLISSVDDAFHITELAREHLTASGPWNLSPYYASLKDRPIAQGFVKVLETGRPANWNSEADRLDWHAAMETEPFARAFTAAMDCRGMYLAAALARRLDLAGRRRLLDVGGGSGIYACSFVAHHPTLRAAVFEQAPVDRIARARIEERGFASSVDVVTGDFWTGTWPPDCDVHLFSNVLHDWDVDDVQRLLGRSHAALEPGGLVVIHDAFIDADKCGPLPVAEYSALLMHATQGKCYSTTEYEDMLTAAGFGACTFMTTVADRGVMTAMKLSANAVRES